MVMGYGLWVRVMVLVMGSGSGYGLWARVGVGVRAGEGAHLRIFEARLRIFAHSKPNKKMSGVLSCLVLPCLALPGLFSACLVSYISRLVLSCLVSS